MVTPTGLSLAQSGMRLFRVRRLDLFGLFFCAACLSAPLNPILAQAPAKNQNDAPRRAILDPSKVPSYFQTGRFRSARWDGGPIEAEKGRLSGWPNYTEDDSQRVLEATRDWYNPRTIEFLKKAHINWAWLTWSVGFSPETERPQQELVRRYIELCHRENIRVAAYFSIGNMFWKDMFEKVPESIAWVDRTEDGGPRFYTRPNRYMANISHPEWLKLQRRRTEDAVRAGADALWIDNTFGYYGLEKVTRFLDEIYEGVSRINPQVVIMSNYNRRILTWGRLQNGVTTEDGEEPGYYGSPAAVVSNAGLLRHQFAIGEGWRPVSVEFGGRENDDLTGTSRMTTPMAPARWQLAIAECAMYGVSLEPFFEGLFLRDLYFGKAEAMKGLEAIGAYNAFLERNEAYYTEPRSLARVAILTDTTDEVLGYLNGLSAENLNYDVMFNYQHPTKEILDRYVVLVLPNTNPLGNEWRDALGEWVREGGTLIAVQDAGILPPQAVGPDHEMVLGPLLGISQRSLPNESQVVQHGKGNAIYIPQRPPAAEMTGLIRKHLGRAEDLVLEPRPAILSNAVEQPQNKRIVLHLLNYRQDPQRDLRVRVRRAVTRVEILSPDAILDKKATIQNQGDEWIVTIPELRTYNVVAIYGDDN